MNAWEKALLHLERLTYVRSEGAELERCLEREAHVVCLKTDAQVDWRFWMRFRWGSWVYSFGGWDWSSLQGGILNKCRVHFGDISSDEAQDHLRSHNSFVQSHIVHHCSSLRSFSQNYASTIQCFKMSIMHWLLFFSSSTVVLYWFINVVTRSCESHVIYNMLWNVT